MFVSIEGGYTYVSSLPIKKGDIFVAPFGYGDAYLIAKQVGDTAESVGSTFKGALCQVERVLKRQGAEAKQVRKVLALEEELSAATAELLAYADDGSDPKERPEIKPKELRFFRLGSLYKGTR